MTTVQLSSKCKASEITAERLQEASFFLISECMRIWESYREVGRSKASKIASAAKIHDMITDALRLHPDLAKLKELERLAEELEERQDLLERNETLFQQNQERPIIAQPVKKQLEADGEGTSHQPAA